MSARTQARKLSMPNMGNLVSYKCQHGHKLVNYQCQTRARSLQLSMSIQTQGRKLPMPNTGTIMSAINVKMDTSEWTINAKQRNNLLSYQCQYRHKFVNYQCQTGHNLVSYQYQSRHKLINYQCQTAHNVVNSFVKQGTNYSLTIIKTESIPTDVCLEIYVTGSVDIRIYKICADIYNCS